MPLRVRHGDTDTLLESLTEGERLSTDLVRAGVPLKMECGGGGSCGTCSIKVANASVVYQGAVLRVPAGQAWTVRSCQTCLAGADGDIEVLANSLRS